MLRTALLPFSDLVRFNESGGAWANAKTSVPSGANLSERVNEIRERSELREAIFFASRKLEARIDPPGDAGVEHALARYFVRCCSRATPFGTCAGISMGRIESKSRFELGARDTYRRHTRPSMALLSRLLSRAAAVAGPADGICYELTPSAYWAFGRLRFSRTGAKGQSHPVVDVEPTAHLELALACAANGATLMDIARSLAPLEIGEEAGLAYARALVDHCILTPCWLPAVTGREPFLSVCRALASHECLSSTADLLGSVCERLEVLDNEPIGRNLGALRGVARTLEQAGEALGIECSSLLQADLVKPAPDLSLGESLAERLLNAAWLVQRTATTVRDGALADFCRRFTERYGTRSVPLVEAVDGDLGLGFGDLQRGSADALLHGLGLGQPHSSPTAFDALDGLRLEVLTQALRSGAIEVLLDPRQVARFPERVHEPLPESFAVTAQLACRDGHMTIVDPRLIAPSGVASMARFCHAEPALEHAVRAHVELEQARAGVRVLVDVAYLSEGDVGNILLRPSLRAGEIAYAGKSGAIDRRRIPITDLYLTVDNDRVRVYSRRLQRPVSIRITNAHDHGAWQNLPIYRFLGALQEDDRRALPSGWSWGVLETRPFLPRVVCEDVVLSRARWLFDSAELELEQMSPVQAFERVRALREQFRLPRWVTLSRGETPLVIDLESSISVQAFVREARGAQRIALYELLPDPEDLIARGPEGSFVGEVVVPFVLRRAESDQDFEPPISVPERPTMPTRARSFGPGSEWLYAKIYAGPSLVDALLRDVALDLVPALSGAVIERWFAVPYADPESHLRLRFRGIASRLLSEVLPALQRLIARHQDAGSVYRLQLDTYEREIERFGGVEGMDLAEQAFQRDSEATARVLELCANQPELRWQLALLGVDRLLADFVPELEARAKVAAVAMEGYRSEFGVDAGVLRAIGVRYRSQSEQLHELLWPGEAAADQGGAVARAALIYEQRSDRLRDLVESFNRLMAAGCLAVDREAFVRSLVHMHALRMLGTGARAHELVIYDFLRRQYASRIARTARGGNADGR